VGIEPNALNPMTVVNNLYFPDQLQNVGVSPEESTACER